MCKVQNCENKVWARGYCNTHLGHLYRYGEIRRTPYTPNEIVVNGGHAEVILYDKNCQEVGRALIDASDVKQISESKWYMHHTGYAVSDGVGLHTAIMGKNGIDHKNRNPLDCRRENLRDATHAENCRNRKCKNSSGVQGVSFTKSRGTWMARISVDGKSRYLGDFKSLEEAAQVRREAALKYHGEFAVENNDDR